MTTAALAKLEANAPDIARMLRVFANEQRVRILCRLAANKDELSITALAEAAQMAIGIQKRRYGDDDASPRVGLHAYRDARQREAVSGGGRRQ